MSDNKSMRIKANVSNDTVINVNINQDIDILEILSLKIETEGAYKLHTSDYGCIAGRVLANGNFGIPNAKISLFIQATEEDLSDNIISYLYPYTTVRTKNNDKIRYNLLPEDQIDECHRNVGTFPSKRLVLDDNNVLEVYDKYYKFTTRSNESGDYMLFGVPTGEQTVHIDIDLSDIGILSQKPRDLVYKGYNVTQFENANMFKKSNNLDNLTQIITQNSTVHVYPFWGEETEDTIAITRNDVEIQYEFQPTCIFMGSVVADETSNAISKRCIPSERLGKMDRLTAGSGTIEMIRKTPQNTVEEITIQGDSLIDGNGVWCYQIPMNLDYVRTDEYGNIVPTDDPNKGIPTRARMRFRLSLNDNNVGYTHLPKVLVPNNPKEKEDLKNTFAFGTYTDDDEYATKGFRDLFWNNVYTVKSYIPRLQRGNFNRNRKFSGIKGVNVNGSNNPIPYNNMRVDLTFMFALQCAIFKVLLWLVGAVNKFMGRIAGLGTASISRKMNNNGISCVYIGDGYCPNLEGYYFAPNCKKKVEHWHGLARTSENIRKKEFGDDSKSVDNKNSNSEDSICVTNEITYFVQCVELFFAEQYEVIQFDFYNDWINGMIYMPRWYAEIKPKRSYLFGLIRIKPKLKSCMEDTFDGIRNFTQQCALVYSKDEKTGYYTKLESPNGCKSSSDKQKCHKRPGRKYKHISGGYVHSEENMEEKSVYYLSPCRWMGVEVGNFKLGDTDTKCNLFATDIVLIGSMNKYNLMGIPQSFEKLTSSSYQLPDTLATTNVGVDGFFYGFNSKNTTCSGGYTQQEVNQYKLTKDLDKWSNDGNTRDDEVYASDKYGETEYSVTEAAGIDWGYYGPNQDTNLVDGNYNNDDEGNKFSVNNLNKLYFPGGHFLGISCGASEVNIKSCVNLSRICEVGSIISQRKAIIRRGNNNDAYSYTYSYLIPTGLISKDDINDYGFKNEFATLNYNGLKTKINPDTNLLEYDFTIIHPTNFNGDLQKFSSHTGYNLVKGIRDLPPGETFTSGVVPIAYRRTIEEKSSDYYKFRLGYHDGDDAKNKYLYKDGLNVGIPIYDNSFYFYFGIKNGSTAFDKFYTDFYAQCPSMSNYDPEIVISTTADTICTSGDNGKIEIVTRNIDTPIQYFLYNDDGALVNSGKTNSTIFEIENVAGGKKYKIDIFSPSLETNISKEINVEMYVPSDINNIYVEAIQFKRELDVDAETFSKAETAKTFEESYGYFVFSGKTIEDISNPEYNGKIKRIYIEEDSTNYYHDVYRNSGCTFSDDTVDYGDISSSYTLFNHYCVWKGNVTYNVYAEYICDDCQSTENILIFSGEITMPAEMDMLFNGSNITTYNKNVKHLISSLYKLPYIGGDTLLKTWYAYILNRRNAFHDDYVKNYIKEKYGYEQYTLMLYNIEKALFYQNSLAYINGLSGSIGVTPSLGTPPYKEKLKGSQETLIETNLTNGINGVLSFSEVTDSGETVSLSSFLYPTKDTPNKNSGYFSDWMLTEGRVVSGQGYSVKSDYLYNVSDSNSTPASIPYISSKYLTIPSIYRPFYFNAIIKVRDFENDWTYAYSIVNGVTKLPNNDENITTGGDFESIKINGINSVGTLRRTEHDYVPLDSDDNYDPLDIEKSYPALCYTHNTPNRGIPEYYSFEVSELSGETLEEVMMPLFIGNGYYYDSNVTYFLVTHSVYDLLYNSTPFNSDGKHTTASIATYADRLIWNNLVHVVLQMICYKGIIEGACGAIEISESAIFDGDKYVGNYRFKSLKNMDANFKVVGISNSLFNYHYSFEYVAGADYGEIDEDVKIINNEYLNNGVTQYLMQKLGTIYPRHENSLTVMMFYDKVSTFVNYCEKFWVSNE